MIKYLLTFILWAAIGFLYVDFHYAPMISGAIILLLLLFDLAKYVAKGFIFKHLLMELPEYQASLDRMDIKGASVVSMQMANVINHGLSFNASPWKHIHYLKAVIFRVGETYFMFMGGLEPLACIYGVVCFLSFNRSTSMVKYVNSDEWEAKSSEFLKASTTRMLREIKL